MKQKGIQNLALKQVLGFPLQEGTDYRFIREEVGLVRSIRGIQELRDFISIVGQPYRLTEGRVVCIRSGQIRLRVNLIDRILCAGQLVVASSGTLFEVAEVSADCDFSILAFGNRLMEEWRNAGLLKTYLQGRLFLAMTLDPDGQERLRKIFGLLWDVLHDEPFSRDTVGGLIAVLFSQIDDFRKQDLSEEHPKRTRQEEIFERFIELVNRHAVSERRVSFYAGRLFLTPRYLNTLIRQVSQRTVMDWVNEAVVQEAKLLLRHTDKPVYQIADELNFPNPSFFCRFFRRMTGKTPHGYRGEK